MISLPDCQRAKCGAKNFFRIPICLLLQIYFLQVSKIGLTKTNYSKSKISRPFRKLII